MKIVIATLTLLVCVFVSLGSCAYAQDRNWDGTPKQIAKEKRPLNRGGDFLIASSILLAVTVYDVEMTMRAGREGVKEGNPWARSFVEKGRAGADCYGVGLRLGSLGIAYAIFKSKDPDTQRKWIVLPVIGIAGHAI